MPGERGAPGDRLADRCGSGPVRGLHYNRTNTTHVEVRDKRPVSQEPFRSRVLKRAADCPVSPGRNRRNPDACLLKPAPAAAAVLRE